MAMPPSVIVLMESPSACEDDHRDQKIDSGIAVSEMKVVRTLSRKANSTIATTTAASTSTRVWTLRWIAFR
jgi:hypothetical protein